MSKKYPKGSEWRKWDLHIHTPYSIVHNYKGQDENEKWELFIQDLENLPPEFKVLGINDYLFIEGYEKLLDYRSKGRLKNIETIFPVIEFRIKKFGGHKEFKRINFHVIFSDKLSPDLIRQQFLNQLNGSYHLAAGVEDVEWHGVITKESLEDLGREIKSTVPAEKLGQFGSDREVGFNNINFDEEKIIQLLKNSFYLKHHFLTAIGKTEWDAFKWDDSSIAEKKSVINKVDFVFTSSETIDQFGKAKKSLSDQKVNHLLMDCSDSHNNSSANLKDRIGKCFTWVKADPSFEGLKQVLNEPERLFVGDKPALLERVHNSPSKFISSVNIRRLNTSSMPEIWYNDINIQLNPSLVAVIGNKGNGKSALTDILGLVGNSYNDNYSFLTKSKFRNPRPFNRASNIEAKITWHDGTVDGFIKLDASINQTRAEKVKYIPQNFLEQLCVDDEEPHFEKEIKKIIFSHTPNSERMGYNNLDELIAYNSEIINQELSIIKGEIDGINQKIIILEQKNNENYKKSLKEELAQKEQELINHEGIKPKEQLAPSNNPELEAKNLDLNNKLNTLNETLEIKKKRVEEIEIQKSRFAQSIAELNKSRQSLISLNGVVKQSIDLQREVLKKYELDVNQIISINLNLESLNVAIDIREKAFADIEAELKGNGSDIPGLLSDIISLNTAIKEAENKLDEPFRLYQKYVQELGEWENRKKDIIGNNERFGSIEYLRYQLMYSEERLGTEIGGEMENRNKLVRKLYKKKSELIDLYRKFYHPITDFIQQFGYLMKEYQINLSVSFTLEGFAEKFFDHVSQGAKGTYIGIEEGNRFLSELLPQYDFNNEDSVIELLNAIRDSLFFDKRPDQENSARDIELQLKKGYTVHDLYRFIFSLDYLKPTFKLNLGTKPLSELSPGERGALLLIFYLFLDKDDKPLIIDQPEENLDNQSVYHYLVHFIKEAKQKRQIIIVTHNPNLAVVCDAEQIIHMTIAKSNLNKVAFNSGSIEDEEINKTIVDILEGTKPAFKNRTDKYSLRKV